ncbi:hypothetical protein BGC33_01935, partial [Bathymodiolus thermophilus thioautotrophic gill symbiont]
YIVYDWHLRIQALNVFMQDENAQSLVEANKRIKNILKDEALQETDANFSTQYDQNFYNAMKRLHDDAVKRVDTNSNDDAIVFEGFLQQLVEDNKRKKNILKNEALQETDANFSTQYDQNLYNAVKRVNTNSNDYTIILKEFLQLKPVIDDFFDNVMVNDEDLKI